MGIDPTQGFPITPAGRVADRLGDYERRLSALERGGPDLAPVDTLPAQPRLGQLVCYQTAAMASAEIEWVFRYAGPGISKPWRFVGGVPLTYTDSSTTGAIASTGWLDPATVPTFDLPLAGDYFWGYGAQLVPAASSYNGVGIWDNAGTTHLTTGVYFNNGGAGGGGADMDVWKQQTVTGLSIGTYKMRYIQTAANGKVGRRSMTCIPLRVSA